MLEKTYASKRGKHIWLYQHSRNMLVSLNTNYGGKANEYSAARSTLVRKVSHDLLRHHRVECLWSIHSTQTRSMK